MRFNEVINAQWISERAVCGQAHDNVRVKLVDDHGKSCRDVVEWTSTNENSGFFEHFDEGVIRGFR
jgi:hypothetical protein